MLPAISKQDHITVLTLWNYRIGMHNFSAEEMLHIASCDDCLALLGLCQISKSIREVQWRLLSSEKAS
jgi:hypothetical protein